LLTARVQSHDVAKGLEAGANDYIAKPFSPEDLQKHVAAVLAEGPALRPRAA
jgi:two-component system phosphate regulon response regulator OmpR